MPPNSDSNTGVVRIIRTRLLTFVPKDLPVGNRLVDLLGTMATGPASDGKLYIDTVSEDVPPNADGETLWGIISLTPTRQGGDDGGFMRRGDVEVQFFGRPKRVRAKLGTMGDRVEEAVRAWVNRTGGYIKTLGGGSRETIKYDEPADREMIQERIVFPVSYLPDWLAKYSNTP